MYSVSSAVLIIIGVSILYCVVSRARYVKASSFHKDQKELDSELKVLQKTSKFLLSATDNKRFTPVFYAPEQNPNLKNHGSDFLYIHPSTVIQ